MYGYIYKTTNLINNKIYIGQHKAKTFNPKYKGSGKIIQRAFAEYGKENFVTELLVECASREELDAQEIYYITKFDARNTKIGYNITQGGQKRFFTGQHHSEDAKEKMSQRAKNRPHPPTTRGRICITNGEKNQMIHIEELDEWVKRGWYKGKKMSGKPAWNKGLTKETDERLAKIAENRLELFKKVGQIGCFGEKGNQHGFKKGQKSWNTGMPETTHNLSLKRKDNNK